MYANPKFNWKQMDEILTGLEKNLNVSVYANPKFDWEQMEEIRIGLEKELDVSVYAHPNFDRKQMRMIRESLLVLRNNSKEGIDKLLNIIYNTYIK